MNNSRVVVTIEGGVLQGSITDRPIDLMVIDYDTEGNSTADIIAIPQAGAATATEDAFAWLDNTEIDPKRVDQLFHVLKEEL